MANTPQGATASLKTVSSKFFQANSSGQQLFAVVDGVPVEDALNWASCLIASVIDTLESLADEHGGEPQFFTAMYVAQMAQAAVNASNLALKKGAGHE